MEEILALPETGPGETQETWAFATFPGKLLVLVRSWHAAGV